MDSFSSWVKSEVDIWVWMEEAGGQLGLGVEGGEQFVQKHQGEDLHL